MAPPLFSSPFPKFKLSLEEKEELVRSGNNVLDQVQQQYENFLWQDREHVSSKKWEMLREKDDVRVYRDRTPGAENGKKRMHLLLTEGTIKANFNDAMYGCFNHTTDDMRIKTAYVQDTLLDSAVMETILEPTPEQPFQSMTVRWFVKAVPFHARLVSKHLDSVYFQANGVKLMSNGEKMGYHLMHSLVLDKAPPIPAYDRMNFTVCLLWRQKSRQRVQAFITTYMEVNENFVTPFVVKSMADAVISISKYTDCAQLKKLAWLVRRKRMISDMEDDGCSATVEDGCSVCGSHSRSARKGMKSACAACAKYTCDKCRTKRELSIFAPDGELLQHTMRFCLPCMAVVRKLDAAVVSLDEASGGAAFRQPRGYSEGTSGSESSQISGSSHHHVRSAWSALAKPAPSNPEGFIVY